MRFANFSIVGVVVFLGLANTNQCAAAEDYAELLTRASESLNQFDKDHWAYTETSVTTEGTFVARYDGRRPDGERWSLDIVNDRAPTDDERDDFLAKKRQGEESSEDSDDDSIESMVNVPTLNLIEETESYWLLNFEPRGEGDDEAFMEHVDGELKIAKDNIFVSSIQLRSRKSFKPGIGIKIHEFLTVMQFAPIGDTSQIAPRQVDFKIKARAFLVKSIDEQSTITYSDYVFVGG